MAFKNMLAKRLLGVSRICHYAMTNCRTTSPSTALESAAFRHQKSPTKIMPDPGDDGVFRRYLHRQSSAVAPVFRILPTGVKLLEKLQIIDVARNKIRLDGLIPPAPVAPEVDLTVDDAKKILRLSLLEKVKARLRQIEKDIVSYSEFLEICAEECSDPNQALEFAKMLDESGNVIILGSTVFLRPEQVVKAVKSLLPHPPPAAIDRATLKELEQMEKKKAEIDAEAGKLVRRELWLGLGYLVIQTAAFMRLTFWDLTWDVMEPICFYVTSIYFMGGYAFFLRTSKEPSFEGFYQRRLAAKQKKLIKARSFDLERYHQLVSATRPPDL